MQIVYYKDKVLGQGGFAHVFEGRWNERKVAVKRVLLEDVGSTKQEEEALQRLNHPNVIKLFHVENNEYFR